MRFLKNLFKSGKEIPNPKDSQTQENTIEISGEWMNQIWAEKPIIVFNDPEAANNFLSRSQLPYLWADIDKYVEKIDKNNNSQRELRVEWTAAYLSHPNPKVVEITLKNHVTSDILNSWLVGAFLPELLAHNAPIVQEEAAKALWRNKGILKSVFGVLTGGYRGITSTAKNYLDRGVFKKKTEMIVKILRKNCPSDSKQLFEDIVRESFGPSYTEKGEPKDTNEVQYKECINKTKMGIKMTYEIFTAPNKEVALTFLGNKEINEQFFYIIVETKDGNWGKDINGIFEE